MPRTMDIQDRIKKLRNFYRLERRPPSYTEMMELFDYQSKNAVFRLLKKLESMGYVTRGQGRKISFTSKLTGSIKMLGAVQAGFPSPAEEELVEMIDLDQFLISHPDTTFMLTVSGESMIEAGIHPGDTVLVEKSRTAASGDIVVAQVDGEWTLKYLVKKGKAIHLEPANKDFEPIYPEQSLTIGGVVTAVIRKYV